MKFLFGGRGWGWGGGFDLLFGNYLSKGPNSMTLILKDYKIKVKTNPLNPNFKGLVSP
jgi:hypothetical protein